MANSLEELLPLLARLAEVDGEFKSLADLAAEDGRSPFHIQRIFSAEVGESPLQFRRRVRLQRAAALLLVTGKSVLDVALDAGFDSHEGFTRAFKAWFGIAPSKFRKQRNVFNQLVRDYQTHLEVSFRTAPCVGLYRVSLADNHKIKTERSDMNHEVTRKKIDETPFLFIERQVRQDAISEALGSMFGSVYQFATAQGIPFTGRPTARYLNFGPGLVTIRAGMPITISRNGAGEIEVGTLPGGNVAATIHQGSYDTLTQAHESIQKWLTDNNEESGGAPWEVYITDPGEVPDPAEWQTEVVWPLKA